MRDDRLGASIRVLRHRRDWRQKDLSRHSGVSEAVISDLELGKLDPHTVGTIRRVLGPLGARMALDVLWGGRGDLPRLLDADHAWLQQRWMELKATAGWLTWPEASFNHYGERGVIDVLSFQPVARVLDVSELKTGIWDVQELLGTLDVKVRNARRVGAHRGWRPDRVVASLVVLDGRTARRRLHDHAAVFARFDLRGRAAVAWQRRPHRPATGLLVFISMPYTVQGRLRQAGRRRVRPRRSAPSVEEAPVDIESGSGVA